jgi:hypothetical protein
MKKALFLLLFGLLPIWLALLLLAASAYMHSNPGIHFNSAPWLIVVAVLCTVVTLTLAIYALRRPAPGDVSSQPPNDNTGND